jgi:alpha-ketoglutarate-dependent taurine dioxygenase
MADVISTKKLSSSVGVEVLDVDMDRLLHDPEVPGGLLDALEDHGVLLFRSIGVDDQQQVAFGKRLGELVPRPGHPVPEITVITQGPENHLAEYFKGNAQWHIDGAMDDIPCKAGILSARIISSGDSGTEFASTYLAYDDLTDEDKAQVEGMRIAHSLVATMRGVYENPTPEQVAGWHEKGPAREHPLVWKHRSGRKSLVLGATADHVIGMDVEEGRDLLKRLLERATRPERVVRHDWAVGDMVIWDNTGVLHRVTGHDPTSTRELHRATVDGDEPIE